MHTNMQHTCQRHGCSRCEMSILTTSQLGTSEDKSDCLADTKVRLRHLHQRHLLQLWEHQLAGSQKRKQRARITLSGGEALLNFVRGDDGGSNSVEIYHVIKLVNHCLQWVFCIMSDSSSSKLKTPRGAAAKCWEQGGNRPCVCVLHHDDRIAPKLDRWSEFNIGAIGHSRLIDMAVSHRGWRHTGRCWPLGNGSYFVF